MSPGIQSQEPISEALAPGSKLLSGQYEILRYLSSGGFGITYLARDSLHRKVVIEECFPEAFCARVNKTVQARTQSYIEDFRAVVRLFIREAHALSRLKHPSVVGVHQVFEDNRTAYMALDLVDGKDLLDIIQSGSPALAPHQIRKMTLELLDAIGHVHGQDLLHRDISPDNILVDAAGRPVLIDFGAAREEASRKSRVLSTVLVVKDGYSPQEFYVAGSQQTPSADLYALAATLVHLITGQAPPNSQARLSALASNQPDLYEPVVGRSPAYDNDFLAAIDKAMNIVPAERLQSAEEWTLMIDHTKRVEIARAKAQNDKTIDQTVMNLVKSANAQSVPPGGTGCKPELSPQEPCVTAREAEMKSVPTITAKVTAEYTAEDLSHSEAANAPFVEEETTLAQSLPETPYLRVRSKAVEKARAADRRHGKLWRLRPRMSRLATVPVVFCAYFFYAQTVFQIEEIRSATLDPLRSLAMGRAGSADETDTRDTNTGISVE